MDNFVPNFIYLFIFNSAMHFHECDKEAIKDDTNTAVCNQGYRTPSPETSVP